MNCIGKCRHLLGQFLQFAKVNVIPSWAVAEDVPFVRAIRHVPAAMKKSLPAEYMSALDTTVGRLSGQ